MLIRPWSLGGGRTSGWENSRWEYSEWGNLWVGELQASPTTGMFHGSSLPHRCLETPRIACCHQGGYPGHTLSSVEKSPTQLPHEPALPLPHSEQRLSLLVPPAFITRGEAATEEWLRPLQFPAEAALADTWSSRQSLRQFQGAGGWGLVLCWDMGMDLPDLSWLHWAPGKGLLLTGSWHKEMLLTRRALWGGGDSLCQQPSDASCRSQYGKFMAICCNSSFPWAQL